MLSTNIPPHAAAVATAADPGCDGDTMDRRQQEKYFLDGRPGSCFYLKFDILPLIKFGIDFGSNYCVTARLTLITRLLRAL